MKNIGTKNLTYNQRLILLSLLQKNIHKSVIAKELNVSIETVYREIKRGSINGFYDPNYSQKRYEQLNNAKGRPHKLFIDKNLAQKISDLILNQNFSPEQCIKKLKSENISCPSKQTIYVAIDNNLIPNVTRESLHKKTTTMFSQGNIYIPNWIREKLKLNDGDSLFIKVENEEIILKKKQFNK